MPRHIALVIHSLDGGGAEHTITEMANEWSRRGERITLITLSDATSDRYEVDDTVERIALDLMSVSDSLLSAIWQNRRRAHQLRAAITSTSPDVVLSFTDKTNILTLFACRSLKIPVVVAERVDPHHHDIGRIWSRLRRWLYPTASAVVVQTESSQQFFRSIAPHDRVHVIPNCLWRERNDGSDDKLVERPKQILAVGRLTRQKGFDLLLTAFQHVVETHSEWKLIIAGDGPERAHLERQLRELKLENHVELCGWASDLDALYRTSQLFVLSSRYEGFPNVLLEAMAAGLPVVSFDCPSGPSEIIRPNVDGLLVKPENVEAFTETITKLLDDDNLRMAIAQKASEVVDRFSSEVYFDRWSAVLDSLQ